MIGRKPEIRPLTGLRGVAAAWIVLLHFFPAWQIILPFEAMSVLAHHGGLAVDIFFILSGFILSYVHDEPLTPTSYGRFLWLRVARVYPNHLAVLAVIAAGVGIAHWSGVRLAGEYTLRVLPYHLTLTQAWPYAAGQWQWNYPSWSVSAEWFAYLAIFPLCVAVRRHLTFWRGWATAFVSLGIWQYFSTVWGVQPVVQVALEFFAGSALLGARAPGLWKVATPLALGILLVSAITSQASAWLVFSFPLLLVALTSETSLVGRLLSTRGVLWLGKISYALYMSHAVSQKILKFVLPTEHFVNASLIIRLAIFAGHIAMLLGLAALLYHGIEAPMRKLLRNRQAPPANCPINF